MVGFNRLHRSIDEILIELNLIGLEHWGVFLLSVQLGGAPTWPLSIIENSVLSLALSFCSRTPPMWRSLPCKIQIQLLIATPKWNGQPLQDPPSKMQFAGNVPKLDSQSPVIVLSAQQLTPITQTSFCGSLCRFSFKRILKNTKCWYLVHGMSWKMEAKKLLAVTVFWNLFWCINLQMFGLLFSRLLSPDRPHVVGSNVQSICFWKVWQTVASSIWW